MGVPMGRFRGSGGARVMGDSKRWSGTWGVFRRWGWDCVGFYHWGSYEFWGVPMEQLKGSGGCLDHGGSGIWGVPMG